MKFQEEVREFALHNGQRTIKIAYNYAHGLAFPDAFPVSDYELDLAIRDLMIGSHIGRIGV